MMRRDVQTEEQSWNISPAAAAGTVDAATSSHWGSS